MEALLSTDLHNHTSTWISDMLNHTSTSLMAARTSIRHLSNTTATNVFAEVHHGAGAGSVTGALEDFDSEEFPDLEPRALWSVVEFLNHYYIPLILVVGFVGNTLSCVVFLSTHLHLRSSSYYLAALAAADIGFLATLMLVWLSKVGVELFNKEGWCQIVIYLSSVFSFLSVWLIVSFTVERFIAVQYPLHRPHMCTIRRAKITIGAIAVFAFASHSYLLCVAGIVYEEVDYSGLASSESNSPTPPHRMHANCGLLTTFYDAMQVINAIDTVATLILPLVLIVVMNTLIARQLFVFSRKHRTIPFQPEYSLQGTVGTAGRSSRDKPSRSNVSRAPSASRSSATNSHHSSTSNNNNSNTTCKLQLHEVGGSREPQTSSDRSILNMRTQYSITKMLLLISSVFVVINLPSYVFRIYTFLGSESTVLYLLQQFSMLLYYTNFSINFLLYSTYGVTFRRALLHLTRKKLRIAVIRRPRNNSLQFK